MLRLIEDAQSPNRQGGDALTIPELMARFRVPGASVVGAPPAGTVA